MLWVILNEGEKFKLSACPHISSFISISSLVYEGVKIG